MDNFDHERYSEDEASTSTSELPTLVAAFLIKFDVKVGYTINWKRSLPEVEVDNVVEFKSLPSGLHNVKEDLVYFVQDGYAGISAFANRPAGEEYRNAHLVAVGVLVPLSYGRMGRSWLHAQSLRDMAHALAIDTSNIEPLEDYWNEHKLSSNDTDGSKSPSTPAPSSNNRPGQYGRNSDLSMSTTLPQSHTLTPLHPALSILKFLETFGPLIFPLYRAALLRKRILFIASPPVKLMCDFVYNLSLISTIPSSVAEPLPTSTNEALHRIRPFFSIGVHDIPLLEREATIADYPSAKSDNKGWIACSTDEVLALKTNLYDILVHAPENKKWPTLQTPSNAHVKATQRDLRRYRTLARALRNLARPSRYRDAPSDPTAAGDDDEQSSLLSHRSKKSHDADDDDEDTTRYDEVMEPISWSALAYNGFMWWASAGERDAALDDEAEQDRTLLGDLSEFASGRKSSNDGNEEEDGKATRVHAALIVYFHRLTALTLEALTGAIEGDDEDEAEADGADDAPVVLRGENVVQMGLDAWSEADKVFAKDLTKLFFGREADVQGASVECCGIKIC
ncbi:hypothetical protein M501DRAFT_994437 [Patellaria atrata CBS 101060]|uniref:DUF4484 domain-containing protein n=1 Tax=Patellaria atrata CBS 101060 TaxID=1346257 RepID=A0A9P4SKX7_9PEZI|nr:hypothetical protein M501DRAFT_994437 [Patellaria atrata CBS 101060]